MKNGTRIWAVAAVMAAAMVAAQGAELAVWNSTGAQPLAGDFPATRTASSVTVSNLTAGSGLVMTGGNPAGNSYSARGYETTSAAAAMSAGDWWETCLDAGADGVALESLKYAFRSTAAGPKSAQWAWSTDRTTWHYLGAPESIDNNWKERTPVDLSGVSEASRIWLRMVAWGGSTEATAWGGFGQKAEVLKIYGEVISSEGEPTVSFIPTAPWAFVEETMTVQVKARPMGAKVTSMTVSPTPKGTVTPDPTAGTWTFTPAKADSNTTFRLTVVATNTYGTTTNGVDVRVKGKVPTGTITIDFEGVMDGGGTLEMPQTSGTYWELSQAIVRIGDTTDRKTEKAALVFTNNAVGTMRSQGKVLPKGIGKISYSYGVNSGYLEAGRPVLRTLVSEDGEFWVEADAADTAELGADGELAERSFDVGVGVPVYLEFRCDGFSGSAQVNLDDITIQPKAAGTPYEQQKLLKFNVTPGDPGTKEEEDLDGDGIINKSDKNPYDPDVQ